LSLTQLGTTSPVAVHPPPVERLAGIFFTKGKEMKDETKKALIRLKELKQQAGSTLFERIKLAHQALGDVDFIAERFEGDLFEARDGIQAEFFPDLVIAMDFHKILNIYAEFPDEKVWKRYKYNLLALECEYDENHKSNVPKRTRRAATLGEVEELSDTVKSLSFRLEKRKKENQEKDETISTQNGTIVDLTTELAEATKKIAFLEGRIQELEEQLKRKKSA
jgi:hypothetical protein